MVLILYEQSAWLKPSILTDSLTVKIIRFR